MSSHQKVSPTTRKRKGTVVPGRRESNKAVKTSAAHHPNNEQQKDGGEKKIAAYYYDLCWEDDNLIETIFSFLDIKSLNQFSQVRKSFVAADNNNILRYKHVVRAALLHAGEDATCTARLAALLPLLRDRKIWAPSPLRLLRVLNGTKCEICSKKKARIDSGLSAFGVFSCASCRAKCTFSIWPAKWASYRDMPRLASQSVSCMDGTLVVWRSPRQESSLCGGGRRWCGPLLTQPDLVADRNSTKAIQDVLAECDRTDNNGDSSQFDAILQAYEDCKVEAENHQAARQLAKQRAQKAASDAVGVNLHAFVEKLSKKLGEHPLRQAALAYDIEGACDERCTCPACRNRAERKPNPVLVFHAKITEEIVKNTVRSRSRVSAAKIEQVATKLRTCLDILQQSRLLDFEFLSDDDQLQSVIKSCYQEQYPHGKFFCKLSMTDQEEVAAATKKGCVDALLTILNKCEPIEVVLTPHIISSSGLAIDDDRVQTARKLVRRLVHLKMSRCTGSTEPRLDDLMEEFLALYGFLALDFLSDDDVLHRHIKAALDEDWFDHVNWQYDGRGGCGSLLKTCSWMDEVSLKSQDVDRITQASGGQGSLIVELEQYRPFQSILAPLIVSTSPLSISESDEIAEAVAKHLFELKTCGCSMSQYHTRGFRDQTSRGEGASRELKGRFDDSVREFPATYKFATLSFISADEQVPDRLGYNIFRFIAEFAPSTVEGITEANGCPDKLWALLEKLHVDAGAKVTSMLAPMLVLMSNTTVLEEAETSPDDLGKSYLDGIISNAFDTEPTTECKVRSGFRICLEGYPTLYQNAVDFLECQETVEWKSSLGWVRDLDRRLIPWTQRLWTAKVVKLLLERDFGEIRKQADDRFEISSDSRLP